MTEMQKRWEWTKRWIHVYCSPDGPAWVHPKIVERIEIILLEQKEVSFKECITEAKYGCGY